MADRLRHALEAGVLDIPEAGSIGVFAPPAGRDLSALPRDRVQVVTRDAVARDWFSASGFSPVTTPEGRFGAALVIVPRAREAAQALIAQAASVTDGPIWIDGQKLDGVDALLKALKSKGQLGEVVAKAHGKIARFDGDVAEWVAQDRTAAPGFVTRPGVFSADGVDPGSAALAEALPALSGRVADLGAGWGWLSAQALAAPGISEMHLVESDLTALDCARRNLDDPRAQFHWADVRRFEAPAFDAIITNPPFHQSRAADPGLGRAFIAASARLLAPRGQLWLVANRHLPYESALSEHFAEVRALDAPDGKFKLFNATKPRR